MVELTGKTAHLPVTADELFEVELADCWQLVAAAVREVRAAG